MRPTLRSCAALLFAAAGIGCQSGQYIGAVDDNPCTDSGGGDAPCADAMPGQGDGCGATSLFNGGVFIIGIQGPDPSTLGAWAGRSANAIVGPGGPGDGSGGSAANYFATVRQYNAAAGRSVFHMMHSPVAGEDLSLGDVWSWEQTAPTGNDEPDANSNLAANLSQLESQYMSWKAMNPSMPVWLNFSGSDFVNGNSSQAGYATAFAQADWISFDLFPFSSFNSWLNSPINGVAILDSPSIIGYALDRFAEQTNKPLIAYVQAGPTSSTDDPVGSAQVRTQMWNAVIHGARGILVWMLNSSDCFRDDSPTENETEIGVDAAWMASLSNVLQDTIIAPVTLGPADPIGIPIVHVGGRRTANGSYYIIQDASNTASYSGSITLPGSTFTGMGALYTSQASSAPIAVANGAITQTLDPNSVVVCQLP